jgi:hypothetical protein
MHLDEFYKLMPQLLQAPLGGIEAQFKLAPAYRSKYDLDIIKSSQPKQAAVLILLYPDIENKIRFVLTKRPDYSGIMPIKSVLQAEKNLFLIRIYLQRP